MSGPARATITDIGHGIFAVDTEYERPQHDASHLLVEPGAAAFVDTGVNASVPLLLDALARRDLDPGDVRWVFVTHVHLDHAGGAGTLMQALPNAQAVLHPRGAPHIVDPAKLVAGTEAVYGREKTRAVYGEIVPVAAERVVVAEDGGRFELGGRELTALYTEGHARHHYVLSDPASQGVFTGDSFGISYRDHDTARGEIVFPTTTPVHFDPGAAHAAVDRIMAEDPAQLYLTHYSRVRHLDRLADEMHAGLDAYVAIARRHAEAQDRGERIRSDMVDYFSERLRAHGYAGDAGEIDRTLGLDIELNSQGLEFWLDRQQRLAGTN